MNPEEENKDMNTPEGELPDLEDMDLPDFDDPDQQSLMPEPEDQPSFWKRYQEVIVTVVILIAIAAGFYLYAKNNNQQAEGEKEVATASEEEISPIDELEFEEVTDITGSESDEILHEENLPGTDSADQADSEPDTTETKATEIAQVIEPTVIPKVPEITPDTAAGPVPEEVQMDGKKITVTATKGDGVTHLARKALAEYLSQNPMKLTNEHKIYIEDYLQNRTSSDGLNVNDTMSFSNSMIGEAITASQNLTDGQLQNLQQYSQLVFG